jgi:signal transduction histidine kinase
LAATGDRQEDRRAEGRQVNAAAGGELDLQAGFLAFIAASRRLEASHAELKARADAVDLQLAATNQALQDALRERDTVFATMPLGIVVVRHGKPTAWNAEGQRLQELLTAASASLPETDGELHVAGAVLRARRAALPDGGTLLVLEDRTSFKRLEQQVDRLDRLAGLSELALGIAHEIKNPLNGVMGFLHLLLGQDDPARMRVHAQRMREGLERIDAIVSAMLGFARPTRARTSRAPIERVVGEAATESGIPLSRITLRGERALAVDRDLLVRVLGNLFRNSVEAAGPNVAIEITAEQDAAGVELTVADDGPGVPRELGQRIFEPFVSSKERGSGLGLALSSRALGFLRGSLELLNPGEAGARFKIRMPAIEASVGS